MMLPRSQAREAALQLLFVHDQNDGVARDDVLRYLREQLPDPEQQDFALGLYDGTLAQKDDLDARIRRAAENWRLERIANLDRNAIRLGAFELLHSEVPAPGMVLNETIELARRFGSAESPAFVNGVLDRLLRDWKATQVSPSVPGTEDVSASEEVVEPLPRDTAG